MTFQEKYTTNEKIAYDKTLKAEKQTKEETKTILSNDAYAVGQMVDELKMTLVSTMRSFIKWPGHCAHLVQR